MKGMPDVAAVTKLLADDSRLSILMFLMDGRFHTVHEIAQVAKVKDHTVSYHLKKFYDMEWVTSFKQGRHVYYQLSNTKIAELLETLVTISPAKKINSFNESKLFKELQHGRTCYCHLAGKLGVTFFNFLIQKDYLRLKYQQLEVTPNGSVFFEQLGIDMQKVEKQAGELAKPCLDWTERTFHLAGNLGKAFLKLCKEKEWIIQQEQNRAVTLTTAGKAFFEQLK